MNGWRVLVSGMLVLGLVFSLIPTSHAALFNRGTDSAGNRLIYDSDLDITWYDYTKSLGNWQTQVTWADNLVVSFDGTDYTNWRLPSTVDSPDSKGFNVSNSEMGHLYYVSLGNVAWPTANYGLKNRGDFLNLREDYYWSGTEASAEPNYAWMFLFTNGKQTTFDMGHYGFYALAVHPGDVAAAVPLPASLLLLATGLSGLVVFRGRARRRRS